MKRKLVPALRRGDSDRPLQEEELALPNIELHYGHWRSTLILAREIGNQKCCHEERRLAILSASIILSRTAIEIYLNESWFSTTKTENSTVDFLKYTNMHIVNRYRTLALWCDIEETHELQNLTLDLDLSNQIRNFCTHYPGPRLRERLAERLAELDGCSNSIQFVANSPQEAAINMHTTTFCYRTILKAIHYIENNRKNRNVLTDEFIKFCEDSLK